MAITKDRPSEAILLEMAMQSKMTFARMARELGKDRKTVRQWCRDAGINKCGSSPSAATEGRAETPTTSDSGREKPLIEKDSPREAPECDIKAMEGKISCLIKWHNIMHDRLKTLEENMATVESVANKFSLLLNIGYKLGAGEQLTDEENSIFADFFMLTRAATAADFAQLQHRVENHWHCNLSVTDSKVYLLDKKNDLGKKGVIAFE